jgi:hypothetical protein
MVGLHGNTPFLVGHAKAMCIYYSTLMSNTKGSANQIPLVHKLLKLPINVRILTGRFKGVVYIQYIDLCIL